MSDIRLSIPTGPVDAHISVPGSKSIANRALVCAMLAEGNSAIQGLPDGDDTQVLVDALFETKCVFIFSRIKKDEDQGKGRCHTKPMMSNETNERIKYTLNMCR